jgi:hypothetical protein
MNKLCNIIKYLLKVKHYSKYSGKLEFKIKY